MFSKFSPHIHIQLSSPLGPTNTTFAGPSTTQLPTSKLLFNIDQSHKDDNSIQSVGGSPHKSGGMEKDKSIGRNEAGEGTQKLLS